MNAKRLIRFIAAGVLLAMLSGISVYLLNSEEPGFRNCMENFTEALSQGNITSAREWVAASGKEAIRMPQNALSEAVYRDLSLVSFGNVSPSGENQWAADATLRTIDTIPIITKANYLFYERLSTAEQEPTEAEMNAAFDEIFTEILSRDDLPMKETLCIVTFTKENGAIRILPDDEFIKVIQGNVAENVQASKTLLDIALGGSQ